MSTEERDNVINLHTKTKISAEIAEEEKYKKLEQEGMAVILRDLADKIPQTDLRNMVILGHSPDGDFTLSYVSPAICREPHMAIGLMEITKLQIMNEYDEISDEEG